MTEVQAIRDRFSSLKFFDATAENGTLEILHASFIADEEVIFGTLNEDYAKRELEWYISQSLNVNGLDPVPQIWKNIADKDGMINSNYGWCIFSKDNGDQFKSAIQTLIEDKSSRQASMIYNRPSMHFDAKQNGMKDFMCTYAVQIMIRNDVLVYIVYMRSNDAVFGYKNDLYWHRFVHEEAFTVLKEHYPNLSKGYIHWNAASLHVYPRHFHLIGDQL